MQNLTKYGHWEPKTENNIEKAFGERPTIYRAADSSDFGSRAY